MNSLGRVIIEDQGKAVQVRFERLQGRWWRRWVTTRVLGLFPTLPQACKAVTDLSWQATPHTSMPRQQRRAKAREAAKVMVK
jgi:hypothetical protein